MSRSGIAPATFPTSQRRARFWLAGLFLAFTCGCHQPAETEKKPPPLPENAVARVGSEVITIEDYQAAMRRRPPGASETARNALLDELVEFRALLQEAKARGYARDPEVIAAFERTLVAKVREEEREARAVQSKVTPEEIEAYYKAHEKTFTVPAKIRVAMIFVEAPSGFSEEKRNERRGAIEEARTKAAALEQEPVFGALAAEYSYDQATKYKGGDLGYLVEGMAEGIEPPVQTAAFALTNPGQLSDVITTPQGFYLLKLRERFPATMRPLDKVQNEIATTVQWEKIVQTDDARSKELLAGKEVEVRRDRLAAIVAPPPERAPLAEEPPTPPAVPGR